MEQVASATGQDSASAALHAHPGRGEQRDLQPMGGVVGHCAVELAARRNDVARVAARVVDGTRVCADSYGLRVVAEILLAMLAIVAFPGYSRLPWTSSGSDGQI